MCGEKYKMWHSHSLNKLYLEDILKMFILYQKVMKPENVINISPNILGGTPVFKGTRVPIETLFDHLERGISLKGFLEDFPSVSRDQAVAVLEIAGRILSSQNLSKIYETAA